MLAENVEEMYTFCEKLRENNLKSDLSFTKDRTTDKGNFGSIDEQLLAKC